ncbi:MAG: FG-GAP-like repeat-containing protein [Pyrinomonadaceae bacterium]
MKVSHIISTPLAAAFFLTLVVFVHGQITVDQTFNVEVATSRYVSKTVNFLVPQPDGKMIAAGTFNSYNGDSVGGFIRLNPDATLDHSFNNTAFPRRSNITDILPTANGNLYVRVFPTNFIRFDPNGVVDPTFTYGATEIVYGQTVDDQDRLILVGHFPIERNGTTVMENVIRLNYDGTVDMSFDAVPIPDIQGHPFVVGGKVFATDWNGALNRLYRFDADGVLELTPVPIGTYELKGTIVQPDGKILIKTSHELRRIDSDGVPDPSFQNFSFGPTNSPRQIFVGDGGRITMGYTIPSPYGVKFVRLFADGTTDDSFAPYVYLNEIPGSFALAPDNSVWIGDFSTGNDSNKFMRLLPNGSVDEGFNEGGAGFLATVDGRVRAILPLPDNKLLIGGDFQKVNGVSVDRVARLNSDGSLDPTFGLTVGTSGNVFSKVDDVYGFTRQPDGKILMAGALWYKVNSVEKSFFVRVNENGDIDNTFVLGTPIVDLYLPNGVGKIKPIVYPDARILVGNSAGEPSLLPTLPLRLNSAGSRDMSFLSSVFSFYNSASIFDIHLAGDGKILISGNMNNAVNGYGFIKRLNPDASIDNGFLEYIVTGRRIVDFKVLPNGKILAVSQTSTQSSLLLFESDGWPDPSFFSGSGANGKIHLIEVLENGIILVGGNFSSYNGQPRANFAVLNPSGTLREDRLDANGEVLSISLDESGRILVGGAFTSLLSGSQTFGRTYLARTAADLTVSQKTLFDYDGDGRSDLSVRRPANNVWYLQRGTAGYTAIEFGVTGDRMVPADYDGDGKTDVAVFRPSNGTWYVFMSQSQTFQTFGWGVDGDMPVPTDRDNDGKADLVIYRESSNTWYTRYANATFNQFQFGVAGDKPMQGDFDGDGVGDVALFRPSNNNWYLLKSSLGFFVQTWGQAGDIPLTGDFDGDGATDQAVFRPSTGQWFLSQTTAGFSSQTWGLATDIPVAADYDGDGRTDVAVFRPSNGTWYIVNSTTGILVLPFGQDGDVPTQAAYIN